MMDEKCLKVSASIAKLIAKIWKDHCKIINFLRKSATANLKLSKFDL